MLLKQSANKLTSYCTLNNRGSQKCQLSGSRAEWNPFGDDNFGAVTVDMLFGKEFDQIKRASNTSEYMLVILVFFII